MDSSCFPAWALTCYIDVTLASFSSHYSCFRSVPCLSSLFTGKLFSSPDRWKAQFSSCSARKRIWESHCVRTSWIQWYKLYCWVSRGCVFVIILPLRVTCCLVQCHRGPLMRHLCVFCLALWSMKHPNTDSRVHNWKNSMFSISVLHGEQWWHFLSYLVRLNTCSTRRIWI